MTVLIALFGGMALLLYGIRLSGEALQRVAGNRLKTLLTGMSRNRLLAVASGAAMTAIIQSSAATTLMLIGFVSAGLMTAPTSAPRSRSSSLPSVSPTTRPCSSASGSRSASSRAVA